MSDVLDNIPEKITAGDSVSWQRTFSDYPASDGWQMSYALVMSGQQITFNATANGDAHKVALTATDTAGWVEGVYGYQAYLVKGADRSTVEVGTVTVLADYSAAASGLDARPHCFIMRDALRALSEGKATQDQLSLSINNRSVSKMNPAEVVEWLNHYESQCVQHTREERARKGLPTGQQIKTQFVRP